MAQPIALTQPHFSLPIAFMQAREAVQRWRRHAQERAQLAGFDARELHDIGLTSADRAALLDKPVWRE